MERVVQQLSVLSETAVQMSRCASMSDVVERALDAALGIAGADRASLLLFDPDDVLRFKGWRGLSDAYRAAVEGHTPWTRGQREPEPILVPDAAACDTLGRYQAVILGEGIRSLGFFPLATSSGTIGKIMVYWREPHVCGRAELGMLRTLSGLTAFALDRQRAIEQLEVERGLFIGGPSVVFKWRNQPGWPIEYVSPNVEAVLGWSAEALRSPDLSYASLVHPDDLPRIGDEVQTFLAEGRTWFHQEYRLRRADGEWRWLDDFTVPIRASSGEVTHLHGYVIDQTDRRAALDELRQRQRIESLGLMAGGVAHDFNNLLVGVLGNATLALSQLPGDSPVVAPVRDITIAAQHASELTRQLLAYSGQGSSAIQSLELAGLVDDCLRLLASVLSPRAELVVDVPASLRVLADPTQLRQIVINLLTNASDALGSTRGHITIAAREATVDDRPLTLSPPGQSLAAGRYVVLRVADDGAGMDEATLAHVFDPFFTTKGPGRGLGLSAVLGIARSHRGAVHVESRPGRGASFELYLPAAASAEAPVSLAPASTPGSRAAARVLVVDDNAMVRDVIARVLELEGHEVHQVDGGERALAALEAEPDGWDAIIMDLTMPRMSGLEALAILRRRWPSLPVVITSGFSRSGVPAMQDDPCTQFLEKPFTSDQLLEVFGTVVRSARRSSSG